jgi:CRISPR-associated RAMP protein (TIGR02581 family)
MNMLKKLVNEAYCILRITTTGPLLVKSGGVTISGPDMTPVRTYRNGRQEIFIPGSSLKGVFRSHIEKIVCSLKSRVVCYPFSGHEEKEADLTQRRRDYRDSCSQLQTDLAKDRAMRTKLEAETDFVYEHSCPTCRLFGSTGFIGRIAIGDAYLVSESTTEQRDGVGIDRFTGGASHSAKFELEVVSSGVVFETKIHLRNFEIWQLGMLFVVLQDLEDELIRLGSGRSRGLGSVTAQISTLGEHNQPGGFVTSTIRNSAEPATELWGLGRWLEDGSYGTRKDDLITLPQMIERHKNGIRIQRSFQDQNLANLREASIDNFVTRMLNWPDTSFEQVLATIPGEKRGR